MNTANAPLRVLMIGAGFTAQRHLRALQARQDVQVVGTVRHRPQHPGEYADPDAADEACAPDAVFICTPTETHGEYIRWAVERGLHLLVEKPLASTPEEARELAQLAAQHPELVMMVAHSEVFTPALQTLRGEIARDNETLTRVSILKAGDGGLPPDAPKPETWLTENRRGRVYDLLIHACSQALLFFDADAIAEAWKENGPLVQVRRYDDTPGAEIVLADCMLGDAVMRISVDNAYSGGLIKEVACATGAGTMRWLICDGREELRRYKPMEIPSTPRRGVPLALAGGNPFDAQVNAFVDAVLAGEPSPEPLAKGYRTAMLATAILDAAGRRRDDAQRFARSLTDNDEAAADALLSCVDAAGRTVIRQWLSDGDLVAKTGPLATQDSRIGRFCRLIHETRRRIRLKSYHVRAFWQRAQSPDDPLFDAATMDAALYSGAFSRSQVLRLDVRCNQVCLFCNVGGEAHQDLFVSTVEAKRLIDDLPKKGIYRLTFTGGEPTLRPDLAELMDYAHRAGIDDIELQTNAVLLRDSTTVYLLKNAGMDSALVSLHSHLAKLSDYLTAAPGTWESTMWGLRRLGEAGVNLRIIHVITAATYRYLPQYMRFVAARLPHVRSLDLLLDQHAGRGLRHPAIVPRLSDVKPFLWEALDIAEAEGIEANNALTIPPCFMGKRMNQTLEYQRLTASRLLHLPPDPYTELLKKEKIKGAQCSDCVLDGVCFGVWKGYAKRYGTDELTPVTGDIEPS